MIKIDNDWTVKKIDSVTYYSCGHAFKNDELLTGEDLIDVFLKPNNQDCSETAKKINGFYSFVIDTPNLIKIVSDHVGSVPLFYNLLESSSGYEQVVVSDCFHTLLSNCSDDSVPKLRELEFRMSTMIAGDNTLLNSIKKTEPGTVLYIDKDEKQVYKSQYYVFRNNPDPQPTDSKLYSRWLETMHDSFNRILNSLDGRQIVIGLSGGYDSRLIVMMLDLLDYDNVVMYTWDKDEDVNAAKTIATNTDYDWFCMNITDKMYREFWDSSERERITKCLSFSGMQYPGQGRVITQNILDSIIDDDAVWFFGHQLFAGGKFSPITSIHSSDVEEAVEGIFEYHFKNYSYEEKEVNSIKSEIRNYISEKSYPEGNSFETIERWYWYNRIPNKFIRNSRFFKCDVWYPLLDKEICEFWNFIQDEKRYNKKIYKKWIRKLWDETYETKFTTSKDILINKRKQRSNMLQCMLINIKNSRFREYIEKSSLKPFAKKIDDWLNNGNDSNPIYSDPTELHEALVFVDNNKFIESYSGAEDYKYYYSDYILEQLGEELHTK